MILYDVVKRQADLHPDRAAWEYFGRKRTYAQFVSDIGAAAAALAAYGLGPGDRIAAVLPNCPEMLMLIYAASRMGAVLVMLNPKSPASELSRQLLLTQCRAIVYTTLVSAKVREVFDRSEAGGILLALRVPATRGMSADFRLAVCRKMLSSAAVFPFSNAAEPSCRFAVWRGMAARDGEEPPPPASDGEADAVIFFSGGSTGHMRAIVHSSRSLNDSAFRCLASEPPMSDREVMLAMLPAFHAFGFTVAVHICFAGGMTCLLMPSFHAPTCARLLARRGVTYTAGVPVCFEKMLPYLEQMEKPDLSAFKHGFCGADMISPAVRDRFNALIRAAGGTGYISAGYGLTECCPVSLNERGFNGDRSIGKPFGGIRMEIFEPGTDRPLPPGSEGEICVCASSVLKYAFDFDGVCGDFLRRHADGRLFLHTGDLGRCDAEGRFYFTCRLRRLIKVSGNTVLAPQVEEAMEELPFVAKAYAVPAPDPLRGSVVRAYVVLKDSYAYAPPDYLREELYQHCRDSLIPWAIPVSIEFCRSRDIPLTPFGKIAWSVLESMAAAGPLS